MRGETRAHLSNCTRDIHTALHHDPVLSRLIEPSITHNEYMRALSAFAIFYTTIEAQRKALNIWPQFSLEAECAALREDLATVVPVYGRKFEVSSNAAALGALYVAHGAAFGRAGMRANCITRLPHVSHSFLRLSNRPNQWRSLIDALDSFAVEHVALDRLEEGATAAFQLMKCAAVDIGKCVLSS